ncbi:MAG: murein L,D-transpeptidase catalytic domain family protein [Chitinophagales bacterium]|nr:murein L,D-transpeptidase catalytic domain family protein [Chitinophagales bacterium]
MTHSFRSIVIVLLLSLLVSPVDSISSMGSGISLAEVNELITEQAEVSDSQRFEQYIELLYSDFDLVDTDLELSVFRYAMVGYYNLKRSKALRDLSTITIIDYEKSANIPRLYVLDLSKKEILYHTLVSHGRNSGNEYAKKFSNVPQSYATSLGFYVTKHTYSGKHGYSLRLEGWDKGFNCKAEKRAIVMHAANYVSKDFAKKHGRIGRSLGCPALPVAVTKPLINQIKNRSCLFSYYPDGNYLSKSKHLNFSSALAEFIVAS